MSTNILTQYQEDLTFEPIDFGHNPYNKNIYFINGKYVIRKSINCKQIYYGTYETLQEAREIRDYLIANNWDKKVIQEELDKKHKAKYYYKNIRRNGRYFLIVNYEQKYCGQVKTIEEALYYRDLVYDLPTKDIKRPKEYDLFTDNPYLNSLEYPIPERLIFEVPKTNYGTGRIEKKGKQSYHIYYSGTYFYACPTYEMAYYMKQELNKCDWDKSKIDEIVDNYPIWYTWLNNFWKFVTPAQGGKGWKVNLTPRNTGYEKFEHIYCHRVEDALWERDLLVKYDFDEETLVYLADDSQNPYFDMELPPYPQRKVRRIKEREPRTELFNALFTLIQDEPNLRIDHYAKLCGTNEVTLRNIFRNEYETSWSEFKTLCLAGENPNDVLEQKPLIYNPDTSVHIEEYGQYKGNITYYPNRKSPYNIYHAEEYYGSYEDRGLAEKIVKELKKVDWDKSKLVEIQAKFGHQSVVGSKRWVYPVKQKLKDGAVKVYGYNVRHKNNDKRMVNYGYYKDKRVAELVRDLLITVDWNEDLLDEIKDYAYYCIGEVDKYEGYQGY